MIIDIHAHYIPQKMLDTLATGAAGFANVELLHDGDSYKLSFAGGAPTRAISPKLRDVETRHAWMHEQAIDHQVCGGWLDAFGYELPADEGAAWSRFLNDHLLDATKAAGQMAPLASVPLQNGALAAEILREALAAGHRGAMIGTQPHGGAGNLDDPDLDPFWATASELGAVIYIHPMFGCGDPRLEDFAMINAVGRGLDTTTAVARLLFSGHFLKYPEMKIVLSHGGGALAFMLGRLLRNAAIHAGQYADPAAGFEKLYFDTVLFDPEALQLLCAKSDPSRIMMGSDYPFPIGDMAPGKIIHDAALTVAQRQAMLGDTAEKLFGLNNCC